MSLWAVTVHVAGQPLNTTVLPGFNITVTSSQCLSPSNKLFRDMPGMNIYQVLLAFTLIYYIQALPLHVSNDLELHESSAAFTGSIFTVKPVKSTGSSPKPKPVTLPVKKDCDNSEGHAGRRPA